MGVLTTNRAMLEEGARQLLQKETTNETEIAALAAALKLAALKLAA